MAQATALTAQGTTVNLLTRRTVATVALIQALGEGWDIPQTPSQQELQSRAVDSVPSADQL